MSLYLDHSKLNDIKTSTIRELNDLKDQWNDNDQKEFYDDKVNELEQFTTKTIDQFSDIDDRFADVMKQLGSV